MAAEDVFWGDLAEDLKDPEFRRGYMTCWRLIIGNPEGAGDGSVR